MIQRLMVTPLLMFALAAAFPFSACAQQPCLKRAWAALNGNQFAQAIDASNDCIDKFSTRAFRDQGALEAAKEKLPPTGAVDSSFDKKKVFDRWAVNDIATTFFIRGEAAEQLLKHSKGQQYKQLAVVSYTHAQRLSYGRCWDPQGWFWSPAEAAADRLVALK